MNNVFNELQQRGFIEQSTDEKAIKELLEKEKVCCYIGFDPTASSLHIGNLVQIMTLVHMQRYSHFTIVVAGAGTALIGDPSGKTEMRKMLTVEDIENNTVSLKKQLSQFISFEDNKGIMLNNADWLRGLNYIDFLRDIGRFFSVNKMLTAECFKSRLEKGLSFLEFNYMLLQSYDFLVLNQKYNCKLQLGGSDQWGNIVAGIELIRRVEQKEVYGMTSPLVTTSSGTKMGKTEKGTVWLDKNMTSPYNFYQYWRNVDDKDVIRFLKLFTFIPLDKINELSLLKYEELNKVKQILAFSVTKIAHTQKDALNSLCAELELFGGDKETVFNILKDIGEDINLDNVESSTPYIEIEATKLKEGIKLLDILIETNLCSSKGDARRLITQGGVYINDNRIENNEYIVTDKDLKNNSILLRIGKKKFLRIRMI